MNNISRELSTGSTMTDSRSFANYDWSVFSFEKCRSDSVFRIKMSRYFDRIDDFRVSDVVIVDIDAAALTAAWVLATTHRDLKISIIEEASFNSSRSSRGSSLPSGALTMRKPVDKLLKALSVPHKDAGDCVVVGHGAALISALLAGVITLPNVKLFNDTCVKYLKTVRNQYNEKVVTGVEIEWALISSSSGFEPSLNPSTIQSRVVIVTNMDAQSKHFNIADIVGNSLRYSQVSGEARPDPDEVVTKTGLFVPGLILAGPKLAELYGHYELDATSDIVFMSGIKAAHEALVLLNKKIETDSKKMMQGLCNDGMASG